MALIGVVATAVSNYFQVRRSSRGSIAVSAAEDLWAMTRAELEMRIRIEENLRKELAECQRLNRELVQKGTSHG